MSQSRSDLARIYSLFGLVNAQSALRARFVAHMKATGLPLVQVRRNFISVLLFTCFSVL